MTTANNRGYDADLLDVPSTRVRVGDGAVAMRPAADRSLDACVRNHFGAGADAIKTKYVRRQSGWSW